MIDFEQLSNSDLKRLNQIREYWNNILFNGCKSFNEKVATSAINSLYKKIGEKEPKMIFAKSPMSAQLAAFTFKNINERLKESNWKFSLRNYNNEYYNKEKLTPIKYFEQEFIKHWEADNIQIIQNSVRYKIWEEIRIKILKIFYESIEDGYLASDRNHYLTERFLFLNSMMSEKSEIHYLTDSIKKLCPEIISWFDENCNGANWQSIGKLIFNALDEDLSRFPLPKTSFFGIGSYIDYDTFICYDFFKENKIQFEPYSGHGGSFDTEYDKYKILTNTISSHLSNEYYEEFRNVLCSGIYEMILFNETCIVSLLPNKINIDSYGNLHSSDSSAVEWEDGYGLYFWNGVNVPKSWILNKDSLNRNEIINEENIEKRRVIMEIIGIEKYLEILDVFCIDKNIDVSGHPIKLYRTKDRDRTLNEYLFYLHVIDPSTLREYIILVPPSQDVEWAKKSTFKNEKIQYRQGDVGLLNLDTPYDNPVIET